MYSFVPEQEVLLGERGDISWQPSKNCRAPSRDREGFDRAPPGKR